MLIEYELEIICMSSLVIWVIHTFGIAKCCGPTKLFNKNSVLVRMD